MLVAIQIHFLIGIIVLAALVIGVFTQVGRRVALWALGAQLIAGLWLVFSGLEPSPWHPALWLAAVILTQGASISWKRGKSKPLTALLVVLALCCAAGAFYLGLSSQH
jgi:hypothetical protein